MTSICSILYEEQLLCSICLGEFNEPVSTPCGHNFCKGCITKYWNSQISGPAQCPLCKKRLGNKPKLLVNTEFRDIVEHFNRTRVKDAPKTIAQPGEVACDVCTKPKLKAHKTCLVCLASYCELHLESHQNLKKHKLIDPVSNLEDRVCKKHDKLLELSCRTDQQLICFMCLSDDHTAHVAVPLECAFKERKGFFENLASDMKKMENTKSESVKKIKSSVQKSRKISVSDVGQLAQVLGAVMAFLQKKQGELVKAVEQRQKDSEKQANYQLTLLDQELHDLRRRRSEIEQFIKSKDYLYLLKSCPSKLAPESTNLIEPLIEQHSYAGMVKQSVSQIKESINNEIETLIQKVRSSDCRDPSEHSRKAEKKKERNDTQDGWHPPKDKLMMIQLCNAVNVTLNPYTAHPHLVVSADGKTLSCRQSEPWFPSLGCRFKKYCGIIANEGFSYGRFYYEVGIGRGESWILGVANELINRDEAFPLTPENGVWIFWALSCSTNMKVGVFVDYEEGEVTFYDTETRTVLKSFTGCCFTVIKTGLQGFLHSVIGLSPVHRPKLYPVFFLCGTSFDTLVITPVQFSPEDA